MAQQQQNITVSAPGFQGLNTEDSPFQQDPSFCLVADNAVVDKAGRIGARKAWAEHTTAVNVTYTPAVGVDRTEIVTHRIGYANLPSGLTILATVSVDQYDAADNVLQSDYFVCERVSGGSGALTLEEVTLPATGIASLPSLTDAQLVSFNDYLYILSASNSILRWDGTTLEDMEAATSYSPIYLNDVTSIKPTPDVGIGAYGRLWVTGVGGDYQTIYYSDLLIGEQWFDGRTTPGDPLNTAGAINVSKYWPGGSDRIVSLAAHNGFLYVFGRQSILIYEGVSGDPADVGGLTLRDAVLNIGCVSRDSVANIGSDVLFVDDSGIRSVGRTIQEKSAAIGDYTYNIRTDVVTSLRAVDTPSGISLAYIPNENIVVLSIESEDICYVLDIRAPSQTGGYKATKWTDCRFNRILYVESAGVEQTLLTAKVDSKGLLEYTSYFQYDGQSYLFRYQSTSLTFGQSANLKFMKQVDFSAISTNNPTTAWGLWGYQGVLTNKKAFTVDGTPGSLFGSSIYGTALYGSRGSTTKRYRINTRGSGESCSMGIEVEILGNSFNLQEINVQTLLGRII